MDRKREKYILSIVLKILICIFSGAGIISRLNENKSLILYFTIQSNIWLFAVSAFLAVILLRHIRDRDFCFSERCTLIQLIFTVSITLTGCVYCIVLVPSYITSGEKDSLSVFAFDQLCIHVIAPILAVVDLLVFSPCLKTAKKKLLWSVAPPLYYVLFSLVGFLLNLDFGDGKNYPYFFLNYASPAGVLGFSSQMPYFMGALYWIILLGIFIIGISALYLAVVNRRTKGTPSNNTPM